MTQPGTPRTASTARPASARPQPARDQGSGRRMAVLVFMGSLLGSLIGTFASIDDLFNSIGRIDDLLNPPPTLCVAGSGTILESDLGMAAAWKNSFEQGQRARVDIAAVGSIGGVDRAAEGGCVHVLAMSEALTPAQHARLTGRGIDIQCAAEIGYDVIAFVTDINNPLPSLLERLMGNVLTGRITNWRDVRGGTEDIYIYARENSGTTDYILRQFGWPQGESVLPPAARYIGCSSNSQCLDQTLGTPGALYWVSVSWMKTQPPRYLRVLPILSDDEAPINPLVDDFDLRDYPDRLIRPLYMYVLGGGGIDPAGSALGREFLQYVRGVNGQKILEEKSFKTYFNRPEAVPLEFPNGFSSGTPRQLCRS
ncbi:MAG: substrate-binding domain-containing protein [Anaerolineae bacterium]|jgi:ABC-type phosphate transport system substrate-binding protein|nr:substrate-binding domain-containing protein [Anaerolineae bacterium]